MKPVRILFFINGCAPTDEERLQAEKLQANVVFRNARAVPAEAHSLEVCDGVAGKVPTLYAEAFPPAEEAISTRAEELAALTKKVGDSPAPKAQAKPASKPQAQAQAEPQAQAQKPASAPAWTPNR